MVRDWLTMTFTRSLTNLRLRQDRLRFRSVANAIRAGIVVDRSPCTRVFVALVVTLQGDHLYECKIWKRQGI